MARRTVSPSHHAFEERVVAEFPDLLEVRLGKETAIGHDFCGEAFVGEGRQTGDRDRDVSIAQVRVAANAASVPLLVLVRTLRTRAVGRVRAELIDALAGREPAVLLQLLRIFDVPDQELVDQGRVLRVRQVVGRNVAARSPLELFWKGVHELGEPAWGRFGRLRDDAAVEQGLMRHGRLLCWWRKSARHRCNISRE